MGHFLSGPSARNLLVRHSISAQSETRFHFTNFHMSHNEITDLILALTFT